VVTVGEWRPAEGSESDPLLELFVALPRDAERRLLRIVEVIGDLPEDELLFVCTNLTMLTGLDLPPGMYTLSDSLLSLAEWSHAAATEAAIVAAVERLTSPEGSS
jgi:hypothetical protein